MTPSFDILVVEDDARDAELTIRALKGLKNLSEIKVVSDGQAAVDLLLGEDAPATMPKLVLLDLKLPKIHGLDVLTNLRAHKRTNTVPIVVLTSSREAPDLVRAYAQGANSYMCKPVDLDEFLYVVRKIGCYWGTLNELPA